MKSAALFLALLLAGCGGAPTEPRHVAGAEAECAANGGWKSVDVKYLWPDYFEVRCNNTAYFKLKLKEPS